jgi:hypothetical protein
MIMRRDLSRNRETQEREKQRATTKEPESFSFSTRDVQAISFALDGASVCPSFRA